MKKIIYHLYYLLIGIIFIKPIVTYSYRKFEKVEIYANHIQPYENPTETYKYFSLPFCQPSQNFEKSESLGEALSGDRKWITGFKIQFQDNIKTKKLCSPHLKQEQLKQFRDAIKKHYLIEFSLDDDIIFSDFVGYQHLDEYYLKTNIDFIFYYEQNEEETNSIIYAEIEQPEDNLDIMKGQDYIKITDQEVQEMIIPFTYTVKWVRAGEELLQQKESEEQEIGSQKIHWISIITAFILVILMISFVIILVSQVVNKDLKIIHDYDKNLHEEAQWKLIKNEVFQSPSSKNFFSMFVGTGFQFFILILLFLIFGIIGIYYEHKKSIKTIILLIYCFTGTANGYQAAKLYKYFGGRRWALNILISALFFPLLLVLIWSFLNSIAWGVGSTAALPFKTVMFILFIWLVIYLPLTVIGALTARIRNNSLLPSLSEKMPKIQKKIPEKSIFKSGFFYFLYGGLIPFVSIFLELYYVYHSIWEHKIYHLYGVIMIAFILLVITVCCVSIALTYFTLNDQDYRWWWKSFLYGGSLGIFIFLYSLYFYYIKSHMFGFIQFSFYFGYSIIISFMIFLMFGSIGFLSSLEFVQYIYEKAKLN